MTPNQQQVVSSAAAVCMCDLIARDPIYDNPATRTTVVRVVAAFYERVASFAAKASAVALARSTAGRWDRFMRQQTDDDIIAAISPENWQDMLDVAYQHAGANGATEQIMEVLNNNLSALLPVKENDHG